MTTIAASTFNLALAWHSRGLFLHGLRVALEVAGSGLVFSLFFGMLLAMARMSKPPLSWLSAFYINVFRGIPALVTVLWVYFGVSLLLHVNFTTYEAGVIALTLLYSAFLAEVFRAALEAIPPGQREAGIALGMRPVRVFWSVTIPQAGKIALPNVGSMFIGMIKDTSVFTVIGLTEIVQEAQNLNEIYFQAFTLFTAAALLYVVVAFIVDFIIRTIEKTMQTPPKGHLARLVTQRRRNRIRAIAAGMMPLQ
jgi:His/Glu/Gln/Arg/opine family amino acid ABC transporter permease subunit